MEGRTVSERMEGGEGMQWGEEERRARMIRDGVLSG